MRSFFKKFFETFAINRRLQIHILTLFLSLLVVSVFSIIAFSYWRNERAILGFSKGTIDRVSEKINEKLVCYLLDLQQLPKLAEGLILDYSDISLNNNNLTNFMLTVLKTYPHLHAFFIAMPDGNFLVAADAFMVNRDFYYSDRSKSLPEGFRYALREINHEKLQETWLYKDASFKTIGKEVTDSDIDFRTFAPYKGAERTGALYWTEIYRNPFRSKGIAVALPVYQQEHTLTAVIGAVLPLNKIADFFSNLNISKSGKAFVLDSSGKIVLPKNAEDSTSALIAQAYTGFHQRHQETDLIEENGKKYLIHVRPFPFDAATGWLIVVLAPLDDFFSDIFQARKETVLISLGLLLLSSLLVFYFSKRVSKPIVQLAQEIDKIKHLNLQSEKRVHSHIQEISTLDASIASMRIVLRSFGHYVPTEIVKQLMEKGKEIALGGEKKNLTILFSDIIGFTPIAESLPTEILMPSLEDYFDRLSKIILEAQGTIDKYIGDSIMAFWGAPIDVEHPAVLACHAALRCQSAVIRFNQEQQKAGKPAFFTRFGIHTGDVIVGNIGTLERMNYTVIGDAVNEAARLERVNDIFHTAIVISDEVYKKIGNQFLVRPLDEVFVKGKAQKIKTFELVAEYEDEKEIAPTQDQAELCDLFTKAYETYTLGKKDEAKALFQTILQKFPNDFPTQLYLDRLK